MVGRINKNKEGNKPKMKKNIYMTIDTETVGGATKPTGAYNYGGVIHDKQGTIYATFSILVMEHYDEIAKDDYAKRNFPIYKERLNNGYITAVATEADAISVKSARFTLASASALSATTFEGQLNEFSERVHSEKFAYVAKDNMVYIMDKMEFLDFCHEFCAWEQESAKNGGAYKVRCRKESKRMINWLQARA